MPQTNEHASGGMARENALTALEELIETADRIAWAANIGTMDSVITNARAALSAISAPEAQREGEMDLCNLIFNNVEASIDYVAGKPIAVLSDVKAAADAVLDAGFRRSEAQPADVQRLTRERDGAWARYRDAARTREECRAEIRRLRSEPQREGLAGRLAELSAATKEAMLDAGYAVIQREPRLLEAGFLIGHVAQIYDAMQTVRDRALALHAMYQPHLGWLYHNPDTGIEWSENHPVESGEVEDATDIRPATLEALKAEMVDAWKGAEELQSDRDSAPQPPLPSGAPAPTNADWQAGFEAAIDTRWPSDHPVAIARKEAALALEAADRLPSGAPDALATLRELVEASIEAYGCGPDDEDDEDVCGPGIGITFGMIRRARVAIAQAEAGTSGTSEFSRDEVEYALQSARVPGHDPFVSSPEPSRQGVEAMRDVAAERERQKTVEGWTPEHDDTHSRGEIASAAACYATAASYHRATTRHFLELNWPWNFSWWKPSDPRRNLVRAGALILAEIERLDRAALAQPQGTGPSERGA